MDISANYSRIWHSERWRHDLPSSFALLHDSPARWLESPPAFLRMHIPDFIGVVWHPPRKMQKLDLISGPGSHANERLISSKLLCVAEPRACIPLCILGLTGDPPFYNLKRATPRLDSL